MNIYDAADELGYSTYYLRDLARRRMIRAVKVKAAWSIPPEEIARLRRVDGPLSRTTRTVRCAAPDCGRVFVADTRTHQRYCCKTCQRRIHKRRWRQERAA